MNRLILGKYKFYLQVELNFVTRLGEQFGVNS